MSGLEMRYFVLKPSGTDAYAAASREAMKAYAECIRNLNPQFSSDLLAWAEKEEVEADRITNFQANLDYEDD